MPLKEKKPVLISFILIKYLDEHAYSKLFNYLHENFNFTPKIIMSDIEKVLQASIKNNENFINHTLHIKCFFHFIKW